MALTMALTLALTMALTLALTMALTLALTMAEPLISGASRVYAERGPGTGGLLRHDSASDA